MIVEASEWTSLEIAKLAVAATTPVAVAVLSVLAARRLKRLEKEQWASQKVIEKRIAIYDEIAPLMNDLLCYFAYIGRWKEFTPPDVVQLKRKADRIAYVNLALFSHDFIRRYTDFMDLCFETYTIWGADARLRTSTDQRENGTLGWRSEWDLCFSDQKTEPDEVKKGYKDFLEYLATEMGVGLVNAKITTGAVPTGHAYSPPPATDNRIDTRGT